MHGFGTFLWTSGQRYDGEWKEGRRDGVGVKLYADGSTFDGFWRDGSKNGVGLFRPSPVPTLRMGAFRRTSPAAAVAAAGARGAAVSGGGGGREGAGGGGTSREESELQQQQQQREAMTPEAAASPMTEAAVAAVNFSLESHTGPSLAFAADSTIGGGCGAVMCATPARLLGCPKHCSVAQGGVRVVWELMWDVEGVEGVCSGQGLHTLISLCYRVASCITPLLPAPTLPLPGPAPSPSPVPSSVSPPQPSPQYVPSPVCPSPGPTLQSNKKEVFIRKFENGQLVREDKLGKEDIKVSPFSHTGPAAAPLPSAQMIF